jgi:mannose-6-phosphate isomerase-like protein (cupin superfamily)
MPINKCPSAPHFHLENLAVTGLAAPSRGSTETCVWKLALAPNTPGTPHTLDREEIFVVLSGRGTATIDGTKHDLAAGDTLIVPPNAPFELANPHGEPFEAVAVLPVGGRATLPGGPAFAPPWTA